jgi:flagellar basal-body rod protein FlgC
MDLFTSMDISASGLSAQRIRMNVISENLANANTTRTPQGTPYRRKEVLFATQPGGVVLRAGFMRLPVDSGRGVKVTGIVEDRSPFREVYDPGHPDANSKGIVLMPNVNVVVEMVNMISTTRAYESNITALSAAKEMAMKTLEIGA